MTSKVNITLGLFVSIFLFMTLPTTAQAMTVSSGDALYSNDFVSPQMMSLSPVSTLSTEDYGIATTNSFYPQSVADGFKTVRYSPSYYTGVDTLSVELFEFMLSSDTDFGSADIFRCVINGGLSVSGYTNGMNYLGYKLWAITDGTKIYINNYSNWISFSFDRYIVSDTIVFGIDLEFAPVFSNPSGSITVKPDDTNGYYVFDDSLTRDSGAYITVSWSGFEWDILDSQSNLQYKANHIIELLSHIRDNMNSGMTNIFNRLLDLYNALSVSLSSWFNTLFEKLDNILNVITNGYDNSSELEAVDKMEDTMSQAIEKENSVNDDAFGHIDSYTINSDGVAGYATQFLTVFPLVGSMMQSIFDSSGAFGIIFSVIFTMTIVCMFIGMFRWF